MLGERPRFRWAEMGVERGGKWASKMESFCRCGHRGGQGRAETQATTLLVKGVNGKQLAQKKIKNKVIKK